MINLTRSWFQISYLFWKTAEKSIEKLFYLFSFAWIFTMSSRIWISGVFLFIFAYFFQNINTLFGDHLITLFILFMWNGNIVAVMTFLLSKHILTGKKMILINIYKINYILVWIEISNKKMYKNANCSNKFE